MCVCVWRVFVGGVLFSFFVVVVFIFIAVEGVKGGIGGLYCGFLFSFVFNRRSQYGTGLLVRKVT